MNGEPSDDSLMERAVEGDTSAFDLIVRRHQDRLQRFACRMLGGDQALAAEIVVGALLKLWEARARYEPQGALCSWLLTACYRSCLDELERQRRGHNVDLESVSLSLPDPQPSFETRAQSEAVRKAVMELPETHRAVIILSAYEGLSYDEIASVLKIPAGTVASRRNTALRSLRTHLTAWEETHE